jgi:ABC-type transporter Mla maintaining outer membrane lipid asymmetry ATPase subunit MlaF
MKKQILKRQVLVILMALMPTWSFARITDFNQMISESNRAQKALLAEVKHNINEARSVVSEQVAVEPAFTVSVEESAFEVRAIKDDSAVSQYQVTAAEKVRATSRSTKTKSVDRFAIDMSKADD